MVVSLCVCVFVLCFARYFVCECLSVFVCSSNRLALRLPEEFLLSRDKKWSHVPALAAYFALARSWQFGWLLCACNLLLCRLCVRFRVCLFVFSSVILFVCLLVFILYVGCWYLGGFVRMACCCFVMIVCVCVRRCLVVLSVSSSVRVFVRVFVFLCVFGSLFHIMFVIIVTMRLFYCCIVALDSVFVFCCCLVVLFVSSCMCDFRSFVCSFVYLVAYLVFWFLI